MDDNYIFNENDPEKSIKPIPAEKLSKIQYNSVCQIEFEKEDGKKIHGTGFFVEFKINDTILRGLMTNNHVLDEKQFKSVIKIHFKCRKEKFNKKEDFEINLKDIDFKFTEKLIDITFIKLTDKFIKNIKPEFLSPKEEDCVKGDIVNVIQYPINDDKKQYLGISPGPIKRLHGINYYHKCSTYKASSGAPLIDNELNVVGIHKSSSEKFNYASKITVAKYAVCTAYERKFIKKEINNIIEIKEMSKDIVKELEKHQLIQQKNKNIFKYKGNKLIKPISFIRTNHAWYWTTDKNIENNLDKKIRHLKCSIIIPHEKKINENNKKAYMPFHNNLIMWLRLSEFMYL